MIKQNYIHKRQNGYYYFCVNIPKRLLSPTTRRQIWRSLRTRDLAMAKKRVATHVAEILPLFDEGRLPDEAHIEYKRVKATAEKLAAKYEPYKAVSEQTVDQLIERINEIVDVRAVIPKPNVVQTAALVGAMETPPLSWAEAFEKFKALSSEKVKGKNELQAKRFWRRYEVKTEDYIAAMGNTDVLKITKNDVKKYRKILKEKIDTGEFLSNEANKKISWLGVILETVFDEEYEGKESPFAGIRISGYEDDGKRAPFTATEISAVTEGLKTSGARPEIKALIRVGMCTGANAKELALLTPVDIHLDAAIPYISIRPNELRGKVKRGGARHRDVPLVGDALAAMREYPNGFTIFHTDEGPTQVNCAMSDFFRRVTPGKGKGFGSFRHNMADWLRRSGANDTLKDSILGHTNTKSHSMHYGDGYDIENKKEALEKALQYAKLAI
ncbi:DUF6538 domain-containing protein [Agrobacterium tumefaciens]|uniref:DUF6538 domain-containing protein n=1 Tax=Agrobacterium tumefaciens TaxID=358 RepID=UPI0027857DDF|nr:DUF6538 domain-containing protein [Agrobacterium tumefaciens]MDP9977929.1 integrase [Agrobacterium tumefaciens]